MSNLSSYKNMTPSVGKNLFLWGFLGVCVLIMDTLFWAWVLAVLVLEERKSMSKWYFTKNQTSPKIFVV